LTGRPDEEGVKDVLWWHPEGREMDDPDWHDASLHTMGMLLQGDRIHRNDMRGNPIKDDTFLLLFNALDESLSFTLPSSSLQGLQGWIMALKSMEGDGLEEGSQVEAGETIELPPRTLWVFQADEEY
jgi:glycogen operon protein